MLRRLAGSIAAKPAIYDLIQKAVGADAVNRRAAGALAGVTGVLVDVGAGTGLAARLQPPGATYLALDLDPAKLGRLRARQPAVATLQADATALPLRTGSCGSLLVKAVTHHLDGAELAALVAESARVLRPGGRLVLLDAVRAPDRWPARLLWAADRGSHPRPAGDLRQALELRFRVVDWSSFAILHLYVLAVAEALPA